MTSARRFPVLVLAGWLAAALLTLVVHVDVQSISLPHILNGPGAGALLGYDDLGRSVAGRLLVGARISLFVAAAVVGFSCVIGTAMGVAGAWLGGAWDRTLVMVVDIFLAFPGLLLAIALAGLLGPGLDNAVLALTAAGWVGFARLARAQTLALKQHDHVLAATALAVPVPRILLRHIVPLILAPLVVQATFDLAGVVIAESTLSFLGIGVQPPQPSWGSMIRDGMRYMLVAPHVVLAPGAAIFLVVLSINLLGDRLRDYLDVRIEK
ncbi:MAG: ABC transporter permease [Gammaproteobacteria bacterium]|jgi:peptide/nickel transport system permease protein